MELDAACAATPPDRESVPVRSGWIAPDAYELSKRVDETERCEPGTVRGPGRGLPDAQEVLVETV